jgi:hypothetical protein
MDSLDLPNLYDQYRIWDRGQGDIGKRLIDYFDNGKMTSPAFRCRPFCQKLLSGEFDKEKCLRQIHAQHLKASDVATVEAIFRAFNTIATPDPTFKSVDTKRYSFVYNHKKEFGFSNFLGISGQESGNPILHAIQTRSFNPPCFSDFEYIFPILRRMIPSVPFVNIFIYDVRPRFLTAEQEHPRKVRNGNLLKESETKTLNVNEVYQVIDGLIKECYRLYADGYRPPKRKETNNTGDMFDGF